MSDKKFLSRHDVDLRLNNCIVRYKEKYFIAGLTGSRDSDKPEVHLIERLTRKDTGIVLDANSKDFQYQFYDSLGWSPPVLDKEEFVSSTYFCRAPFRRYKAGLSSASLNYFYDDTQSNYNSTNGIPPSTLEKDHFAAMLENNYSSIDALLTFLAGFQGTFKKFVSGRSYDGCRLNIALNRDWAVRFQVINGDSVPITAELLFGVHVIGDVNFESRFATFRDDYNNSIYWEKFNEVFLNKLHLNPRTYIE